MLEPDSMDFSNVRSLSDAARAYGAWMREAALPLWSTAGVDPATHAFHDALTIEGAPATKRWRARVQARQVFVYATAYRAGFGPQWLAVARRGFDFYRAHYRLPDGLYAIFADAGGEVLDATPCLYEQAFSLLALAGLQGAGAADLHPAAEAEQLLAALQAQRRVPAGGFTELTEHPYQANAHMHLLEAAMAWDELGISPIWTALSDEIATLCLDRFIDPKAGFLREFFDADWRPAGGDDGRLVEPGHQFEWAWLLERWGRARGETRAKAAARTLFARGLAGVDRVREVAMNELWDDLTPRDATARLWPQTEYLKAALILGEDAEALTAARGLARYLDVPARGAWRDKLRPDGAFVEEPAPASSFYHLSLAVLELLDRV